MGCPNGLGLGLGLKGQNPLGSPLSSRAYVDTAGAKNPLQSPIRGWGSVVGKEGESGPSV